MSKLVIDIETVGESFEEMDAITQMELTKNITAEVGSDAYQGELDIIKRNLVFSPTTGEIVAIGVLDVERSRGIVYFQAPGSDVVEFEKENIIYKPMDERQILDSFWGGAAHYDEFITYNGRGFDIPYINARSAKYGVRIGKNLMSNRYVNNQDYEARHVDLYDQFGYYGAVYRQGSMHMWTRLFGIDTPKGGEVSAKTVGDAFREGKYKEIAEYNAKDLWATKALYEYWSEYMKV